MLTLAALCSAALGTSSCGSGDGAASAPAASVAPVIAAKITQQPVDQSVPMGLAATYSVTATGSSLGYQWAKSGTPIPGATSSTYTTPPTAFADTGASFTVAVSNSAGTVSSSAAALTVTARAPLAGDLRFQQVDAPSTVNGWGNVGVGVSSNVPGRGAVYYSSSLGTPLYMGTGNCGTPPSQDGVNCDWFYSQTPLAASAGAPLIAGYAGDSYDNFQSDLQSAGATLLAFGNGISAVSPTSVITSLDLEPANALFGVSWIEVGQTSGATASPQSAATVQSASAQSASPQSAPQGSFTLEQGSVPAADLQSAATQEGAAGRVITAISVNGSVVTYLAYAWSADTATIYEAQVVTASTPQAPTAAAGLAADGYIITAIGPADDLGTLYLVGTRVQGDTMARPFTATSASALAQWMQQGYAIVGVIVGLSQTDPDGYLLER